LVCFFEKRFSKPSVEAPDEIRQTNHATIERGNFHDSQTAHCQKNSIRLVQRYAGSADTLLVLAGRRRWAAPGTGEGGPLGRIGEGVRRGISRFRR
jgi:hypothetical protein